MKTLLTLLIAFYSLAAVGQKSDTISVIAGLLGDGDVLVFTVGDVYVYMADEENPWGDPVYHYLKIEDAEDGWVKYVQAETIEGLDDQRLRVDKSRDFYKKYLRRNEWEKIAVQSPKI